MLIPLLATVLLAATANPATAAKSPPKVMAPAIGASLTDAEVAPLFTTGPLASARDDFEAGRYAAAAAKFGSRKEPEARWLAAIALARDGRHVEALPLLDGLAERLPVIADRVHLRRGQALDAAGKRREAADAYARVSADSLVYGQAVLARARALDAIEDADGAIVALLPLLAIAPPSGTPPEAVAEALLLAGRVRARGGADVGFARHAWLECWASFPLTAEASDCAKAIAKLPGAAGAAPDPESQVRRAEALGDANRYRASLNELQPVLAALPPPAAGEPLSCRAHYAAGKALRRERQHAKSMAQLGPVVDRCTDPDLRVRALYVLSSASSIASPDDGLARYLQLAREYPDHSFADDALFYAADLHQFAGRLAEARALLLSLAERYPRGDFRAEALFRAGWLAHKLGDRDGAIAAYAALEDAYADDPYEAARAAYWRGRLLDERAAPGDLELAAAAWGGIADRYPVDYYGLLARARLDERQLTPVAAGPSELPHPAQKAHGAAKTPTPAKPRRAGEFRYATGPLQKDPRLAAGVLLLRIGMKDAAAQEFAAVDRSALSAEEPDPLLLLAELLDRAGDHRNAHMLVRTVGKVALRGRPDGASERIWRIAYPPAFRKEVKQWAPKAGVEPDLLQALMREESALDPRVVSPAGAVGLTQLMVPTAQDSARRLKLSRKITAADLMDPSTNIRLGAHHLGTLVKRFQGSAPLAIAAYNVGEAPVRRWVRARGSLPLDAFIEEIPVQETRGYVKRVLRSYAAYHLLLGGVPGDALALRQSLPQLE